MGFMFIVLHFIYMRSIYCLCITDCNIFYNIYSCVILMILHHETYYIREIINATTFVEIK